MGLTSYIIEHLAEEGRKQAREERRNRIAKLKEFKPGTNDEVASIDIRTTSESKIQGQAGKLILQVDRIGMMERNEIALTTTQAEELIEHLRRGVQVLRRRQNRVRISR